MDSQDDSDDRRIGRRTFLQGTTLVAAVSGFASVLSDSGVAVPVDTVQPTDRSVFTADTERTDAVFPQSVASGGPTPEGVLLWTRIAPEEYQGGPVAVEVGWDDSFSEPVHRGVVESPAIMADHDHTITVDLDGKLSPDTEYAYRFIYNGTASRTGRCQTLPDPNATIDSMRLAVLTCQDYQNGYYGAYSHVAEENVDFLLHLGDFIYESADNQYRAPISEEYPDRNLELPSGHDLAHTLADYRYLYNTYRSDPHLQRALERHTLIAGWDDHEVADNRYWDYDTDSPRLPSHPEGDDPDAATRITAAAIKAWVEQFPARIDYEPAEVGAPGDLHERFRLQRRFRFGDLTTLVLTDERLFRDPPPAFANGDKPDRTMLGTDQRQWFLDAIDDAETQWTVWGNEVLTMPLEMGTGAIGSYLNRDAWDGYRDEYRTIMRHLARNGTSNFITLTGDLHTAMAGYQRTGYDPFSDDERVGVEFMTPAVTSVNLSEIVLGIDDIDPFDVTEQAVTTLNPHIEFFDSSIWGYSIVEFTGDACTYTVYSVDKSVKESPRKQRHETLRVPAGTTEIESVER
ncbi:alkaline phosphatase D family protein [Halocatena pleomorpha]|uniref:Alkaline phosphatase n=1 Tax=Halocatena pleomorpha TaxID=1785090 RepID=A0A3P3RB64_9EURY|nr:alkaline phosphatase D family protein [Halocatena pleomorpha]RRJ30721.1 alkaline phosphatase [Halocatena pleomorpha]